MAPVAKSVTSVDLNTTDPDITFGNMFAHLGLDGTIIIWTYSAEGNMMMRFGVEPLRKIFFSHLPKPTLVVAAKLITALLYIPVYSVYQISHLKVLPDFDFLVRFRDLTFKRIFINVYDKLHAPQAQFTTRKRCEDWFNKNRFEEDSLPIRHHRRVSYSMVATKRLD